VSVGRALTSVEPAMTSAGHKIAIAGRALAGAGLTPAVARSAMMSVCSAPTGAYPALASASRTLASVRGISIVPGKFSGRQVRRMDIEDFHMAVGKVVSELDGKFAEDMDVHATT
jgi:hypothetical protein